MSDLAAIREDDRTHPAYTAFVIATKDSRLKAAALRMAWQWFRDGWLAYQAAALDTVTDEEQLEADQEEQLLSGQRKPGENIDCDQCGANPGEPCRTDAFGQPPSKRTHSVRVQRSRRTADQGKG